MGMIPKKKFLRLEKLSLPPFIFEKFAESQWLFKKTKRFVQHNLRNILEIIFISFLYVQVIGQEILTLETTINKSYRSFPLFLQYLTPFAGIIRPFVKDRFTRPFFVEGDFQFFFFLLLDQFIIARNSFSFSSNFCFHFYHVYTLQRMVSTVYSIAQWFSVSLISPSLFMLRNIDVAVSAYPNPVYIEACKETFIIFQLIFFYSFCCFFVNKFPNLPSIFNILPKASAFIIHIRYKKKKNKKKS